MKIKKILIVHAGGIGDLLLALPAMRLFCQNFSPYTLDLLGYPERLALIAHDLKAEAIHSLDKAEMAYLFSQPEALPDKLKSFFSSFESALVFSKSMAKVLRIGLEKSGISRAYFLETFPDNKKTIHVSDYLIAALHELEIRGLKDMSPLQLPEKAKLFANQFWQKNLLDSSKMVLAFHPGSGNRAKNWNAANFAKVADHFAGLAKTLLLSGPAPDEVEKVLRELKKAEPILVPNLPLVHLAGLIMKCTAFLGNDSGITHLAASLGIPTFAIFGPTDPRIWGPKGEMVQNLYSNRACSPCWPMIPEKCPRPCLDDIKTNWVIKKIATWVKFAEQ